jgi:hypothetical protein
MKRPPYAVGDKVKGLYLGERGTTLANGYVEWIQPRGHTGWTVTVQLIGAGQHSYTVSDSGASDYLARGHIQTSTATN